METMLIKKIQRQNKQSITLYKAVERGYVKYIKYVMEKYGMTSSQVLKLAGQCGNIEIVKIFFQDDNYDCLQSACQSGHLHIIKYLISNSQYKNYHLTEPLRRAMQQGHLHIIRYLLSKYNIIVNISPVVMRYDNVRSLKYILNKISYNREEMMAYALDYRCMENYKYLKSKRREEESERFYKSYNAKYMMSNM